MKLKDYLKNNLFILISFLVMLILLLLLFIAFKINLSLTIAVIILVSFFCSSWFIYTFVRKRNFYNELLDRLEQLDQKYLLTEIITQPTFLEGQLLYQIIYETNKSMLERINDYQDNANNFKDYVEMWIHEVKIPLANLQLMCHNQKNKNFKTTEQLKRLEDAIDQVLYYVRSEDVEKDCLIKNYELKKIINQVLLKNKDSLIYHHITVECQPFTYSVYTDSKWLAFIINQIISNSIKYCPAQNGKITIQAKQVADEILLSIRDNGIGIPASDLSRIFDKSFTGVNGRILPTATGMGLYICQNLCKKLGHRLTIQSNEGEFTELTIHFAINNFYDVVN